MSFRFFIIAVTISITSTITRAQDVIQSKQYPKNQFRYPLDLPPTTAGSFGELRANHFHSGLDFKTNQRIGFPVHAAYDGYISRVRVQFGGFGQALYITHPNGYTTVYGHIEAFTPEIAKYIRDYQYKNQTYEADIAMPVGTYKVNKGDVVAVSGNRGASAGPHVHFEIRDTLTQETINPQLFGLTIPDQIPPTITAIGIYHLNGNPFSDKTPKEFLAVIGANGNYHLTKPQVLNLSGNTGFGISVIDQNSASINRNGIYSLELKLDGATMYTFAVERFAFDQTHAINAYIDYPAFITARRWVQKCFILPGSRISLYPQSINRGIMAFNDDKIHEVEYVVKDIAGNTSTLTLKVQSNTSADSAIPEKPTGTLLHYDRKSEFANDKVKVSIMPGNLYDDLDFIYSAMPAKPGAVSLTHRIHNKLTPIHDGYDLWIKPDVNLGANADKAVIVNAATGSIGGTYEGGWVKATAKVFGDYYIKIDTVPPIITPINIRNGSNMKALRAIKLRMSDNLSGIKSYVGKIDGKWVLVEWDYKTKVLSYTFDNSIAAGKHKFEFTVTDAKNNVSTFTAEFYR
ncbi:MULTISPECIES: M23 family metallopeptidase [unclassified Mucilaginibacter]|uniref:M23 family metallopeptidase n=1 Tax=unclassified Mucilaginibacter TaxID=2617802 RepID=UPI002AC93832|nr:MULTISPECIES: M23 family metallopeptidase [unclassified Mucilaginibacter]MEB0280447.1 M23 family metallopeptidase [Mucilaginibacter sp. 10B2]MEB0300443.1 M23 family metallopeptidase [Mucilaginibacter sp. 5C4]WPX23122.1 M23 family metallopeptidase [Mucilaginibacter sp. 5C4]